MAKNVQPSGFARPRYRRPGLRIRAFDLQQGQEGGPESVVLNTSQSPVHTHTMMAVADITAPNPGPTAVLGTPAAAVRIYGSNAAAPLAPGSISQFGSNGAHENRQPYLALNCIIALTGIFPARS
jgi:microcystin-dependent protein